MNDTTGALAAALAKVQAELPTLERDRTVTVTQKNGGTYSYSYVTLASLTEEVMPLLARNGLAFTAFPTLAADGKMSLRYHLLHSSGEKLTGEFPISGEGGIQSIGGRITYSRRYCLAAVVGIAADEDDETHLANQGAPRTAQRNTGSRQAATGRRAAATAQRAPGPPPLPNEHSTPDGITAEQTKKMAAQMREIGITERQDALDYVSMIINRPITSRSELTKDEASRVIDALEQAIVAEAESAAPPFAGEDTVDQ